MKIEQLESDTHELVLRCSEAGSGYQSIIALHSSRLGPAVGGTRLWRYASEADALQDALRLSRGMSYKNAVAGLPLGGGKSVILANGASDRRSLFEAHARAVDSLGGRFITAEDVGTTVEDMEVMRQRTPYVAGLSTGAGDPSPYTAHGVVRALEACVQQRSGQPVLRRLQIAIQGVGAVGYQVARELRAAGADLIVCDPDHSRCDRAASELGAIVVTPDQIYDADVDVFMPCALGAVLSERTIPRLKALIVVGAANNQLATPADGEALHQKGSLYGPDYVANAGGVISGAVDILGWDLSRSKARVEAIFETMLQVLDEAYERGISSAAAADALAERRLA